MTAAVRSSSNLHQRLRDDGCLQPFLFVRPDMMSVRRPHLAPLLNAKVEITDLDGALLGLTQGDTVFIDVNAAGHGWFVDRSPWSDSEVASSGRLEWTC